MSEATQQQSIASCPYCQKSGLPILPLRYAVTRTDSGSGLPSGPELSGSFGEGVTDISLPEGQSYTLRLVRAGYLYVFNEMRGSWSGYVVTERGYLFPYVSEIKHDVLVGMKPEQVQGGIDALLEPPTEDEEFTCTSNPNHHYPGRCITIPDADQADNIYLAFSDTAWTKRVWKEHATNAPVGDGGPRRRDRMRKVSLAEWRSGGSAEHSAPITELSTRVAEADYPWESPNHASPTADPEESYAPPTPFSHGIGSINGLDDQADGLVAWAESQTEHLDMPALMVAVDDPVGIAAELAGLMRARLQDFMHQDHLQRPLAISALIDSLQESIRNQAELRYVQQREESALRILHMRPMPHTGPGPGRSREELNRLNAYHDRLENDKAFRKVKETEVRQRVSEQIAASELDDAAGDAWEKYQDTLEQGQPEQWRENVYQKELGDYDQKYLVPLAEAHQAWLNSEVTLQTFVCNHDDSDAESGVGYVQSLLLCIQDTQEYQVCFDRYQEWLEDSTPASSNLLQRALAHNQQALIDAFAGVDVSSGDIPYDKWAALIGLYNDSLKHVDEKGKNLVAQLIVATGGPVMKVLNTMVDQGMGRLVIFLGVIGEAPIGVVQHSGTVSQALDVMVDMMKQLNPEALGDVDAGLLKRRLEIRSRGQRREVGLIRHPLEKPTQQVRMRVDRFALRQLDGDGLDTRQLANRAAGTVLEMDEWPRNQMARFRTMFGTNARLAVIGLILQALSAHQLSQKLDDSMEHQRTENKWRHGASWVAFASGVGNLIHDGIANGVKAGGVRLGKMANRWWVKLLGASSRALGIAASVVMAVFDFKNSYQAAEQGNWQVAGLYLLSGVGGLGAAVLFTSWGASLFGITAAMASGIGVVLILVGIGVALLIDYLKNNALQNWMERCQFGELVDERYQSLKDEMQQFELAMKDLGFKAGDEEEGSTTPGVVPQAG